MTETERNYFVDDEVEPLCQAVEILEKRISIETGEEELLVQVKSKANGLPFTVSRKEFVKKTFFDKLTHHGLSIIEDDESYAELRAAVNDSERRAPVVYHHESLGFRVLHGIPCFLAYNPIGQLPPNLLTSTNPDKKILLEPQGSFNEWKAFIRQYVVPNMERTLALILGATAPVSYVLKEECEFVDLPVWGLINASSKGKTSLLYMISSLYASPRYFIDSFNATSNALYAMLEERGAYPFLCDEATHTPNIDWDSMLYTLPTGKERRRCDSKGKLKPLVEFGGSIIMTSETSILDRSQGTGGQNCRIMEFELDPFRGEEELAEKTRSFCFKNHGWATEPLISLLFDPQVRINLTCKYRKFFQSLCKQVDFPITGVERRLLQRCALILVSGWILRKAVQCNFNLEGLEAYLIHFLSRKNAMQDKRDEADRLLDKITGFVSVNQDKFPTAASLSSKCAGRYYSSFWGATGFYGTQPCVWIEEGIFEERILPQEMRTKNSTLQALHHKGYLEKFYDKTYHIKKEFGRMQAQYYCVLLPDRPNIIKKIDDISAPKLSTATLTARLAVDHDTKKYEEINAVREVPYLAISRMANQSYVILASDPFGKAMSMTSKTTLYATAFPDDKLLLMSKEKITVNSIPLRFIREDAGLVAKGLSVITLQDKLATNIPIGHRLVIPDVSFEDFHEKPTAILNLHEHLLVVEEVDSAPVDFKVPHFKGDVTGYSHIQYLLNDVPDEDN